MSLLVRAHEAEWHGALSGALAALPLPAPWRWNLERATRWWIAALGLDRLWPMDPACPAPRIAILSGDDVLDFRFQLPQAALASLPELLALEIENATPFAANRVAGAYRLSPAGKDHVDCHILLTPLTIYESTADVDLIALSSGGTSLHLPGPGGDAWRRGGRRRIRRRALIAAVALVLFAAAPYLLAWRAERALVELQPLMTEARTAAAEAAGTQRRLEALLQARARSESLGGGQPPKLDVIAALTQAWADDVSVSALRSEGPRWRIDGVAARASGAITALAALPFVSQAQFDSPITVLDDGREGFSIRFETGESQPE